LAVVFDDERAVSDAGVVLVATLADRLGIEALAAQFVKLGERVGGRQRGPQGDEPGLCDGARRQLHR
jgi:predicted nuclease with TOPRIM domain